MKRRILRVVLVTALLMTVFFGSEQALGVNTAAETAVTAVADSAVEIVTQPKSVTVAEGETARVSVKATGSGLTYEWYYKNAGASEFSLTTSYTGNTYSVKMSESRNGRQVYCVITDEDGNSVTSETATLKMGSSLEITSQPSDVTVAEGETAKVSVKAAGSGLTYEWYYKNAGASKFSLTTSFTGNTYSVTMSESRNGRQVYCVITDEDGNSVTSDTVTLRMRSSLEITSQPSDVTVAAGETAKVSVKAAGSGLTYEWYFKNAGASKFSLTTSFTGSTYSVKMSESRNGRQVYCVITDENGNSVTSDTATLRMAAELAITTQPSDVTVADGATASVSVKATGNGLTYQWYIKNAGQTRFSKSSVTSDVYSATMSEKVDGRQLYCVITDATGASVTTDTVTMSMRSAVKITAQPKDVTVAEGKTAKVTVQAEGVGLTYKWYFRDATSSKFSLTTSFTGNSYSVTMNESRNGRQVYCVITDEYGNSVTSEVAILSMVMPLEIVIQPKNVIAEENEIAAVKVTALGNGLTYQWYIKNAGQTRFSKSSVTADTYKVTMSSKIDGRQVYCVITDMFGNTVTSETATLSMKPTYYITVNKGVGDVERVGVPASGKYSLTTPVISGYTFKGWVDSEGNAFAASGTIKADKTVKAVWTVGATDTLQKLIDRTNAGVSEIMITADMTVNQPIFISHETSIYADGNYTLKRDPNYAGDMFVVGQDKDGVAAVLNYRKASLTLSGGKGTLTIDGNRDNLNVTVVGSALYVSDSAVLNLYDGVRISNHKKLGNERVNEAGAYDSVYAVERAGGAAVLNLHSTVNMYGGVMENNAVATEYTIITNDSGEEEWLFTNACGGAVFNRGTFNMYGGTITGSEALRGGGIYNSFVVNLYSGTVSNNLAHAYGGALATSSDSNADTFIGSEENGSEKMVFSGNRCKNVGGALYSNTSSPIIIYGNTELLSNVADVSGGAIYTAGPLTIRNTSFRGNSCTSSGGAIYHHYTKAEFERRHLTLEDCVFENNSANLGGAVILSASGNVSGIGTFATITDCSFEGNKAIMKETSAGNGGALYITRQSEATITGCTFTENTSVNNAGAIAVQSQSKVTLTDSTFTGNTALNGGALYTNEGIVDMSDLTFTGNSATASASGGAGLGGAIHIVNASVAFENVDVRNNSAATNGGGCYVAATEVTFDAESEFVGNSAAQHGGAFYLTYKTNSDGTKNGSTLNADGVLFEGNTALAGGAISARTASALNLTDVSFVANKTPGAVSGDTNGGGAIYANNGTINAKNVIFDGNMSGYYGGAVRAETCDTVFEGGEMRDNSGGTGAAVYAASGTMSFTDAVLTGNTSSASGVLYANGVTLDMTDVTASGNTANNGGVLYISGKSTTVTVKGCEWSENTAASGGAIYNRLGALTTVDCAYSGNDATGNGGAIYVSGGQVIATGNNRFTENTAVGHAGAIYVTYVTNSDGTTTAGTLNMTDGTFQSNSALAGGAISARSHCVVTLNGVTMTNNSVTGFADDNDGDGDGGGAIYLGYGELNMTNVTATGNTASDFGGVVSAVASPVTITGGTYTNNKANNGGVIHAMTGSTVTINGAVIKENQSPAANAEYDGTIGGGAIHTVGGKLDINGSTLTGNTSGNYGGAVHTSGTTVTINGGSEISKSSGATGAALYFRDGSKVTLENISLSNNTSRMNGVLYINNGTLDMTNVTASGNTAIGGGVLFSSGGSTKVTLTGSKWSGNSATTGGAIHFNNATVTVSDCEFAENSAGNGGAIYSKVGVLNTVDTLYTGNTSTGNGGAITTAGGKINATGNNQFVKNTAAGHAGAIYVVYITNDDGTTTRGALEMTDGIFQNNSAASGGAVSARTGSTVSLTGTVLKGNSATSETGGTGGGAIYTNTNTMTLSGVTLEENTSAYYGGAVFASETVFTVKDNCLIKGNSATTGTALCLRDGGTYTLTDLTVMENESASSGYGAIYTTSGGTVEITNMTATDNKNVNGGVIYASGSSAVTVKNSTLTGNTVSAQGGAIDYRASGALTITGSTFDGNSAKTGGAISHTGTGLMTISGDCVFRANTASKAGAVYLDQGAAANISGSVFDGNTATDGDGGAIVVADSSEDGTKATALTMSGVTLKNNTASSKGGALATDTASPNLVIRATNCTFESNKALGAGGGAVEIQNGNCSSTEGPAAVTLVFTGCTFTGNTAKTTGGAVEIRTSSCAKFDGITATGNQSSGHGGVFYVTSVYSRLYLTGTVTLDNNTVGGTSKGPFVYLYNNSYTCPPKIYTTHTSDAAWCSGVGGNSTNIAFGLTVLP